MDVIAWARWRLAANLGAVGTDALAAEEGFRHEALFYAGLPEFVAESSAFIRDGVEAGERVLVVVSAEKIAALREELGDAAEEVVFADMSDVGVNPARIIPAWRDFVDARGDTAAPIRGIGEPIFPERTPTEMVECHHHEALLNLAFAGTPAFWLLCPYDTLALDPEVVEEAQRTHPCLCKGPLRWESTRYAGLDAADARHHDPLPPVASHVLLEMSVDADDFQRVRSAVGDQATAAGLDDRRADDLLLAAHEIATNSVRHGGGRGHLRLWRENDAVVCELADHGRLDNALAGRARPVPDGLDGYGLWIANHLCDLVQVRSLPDGTAVRLHMRTP
jgi:anti-sigma regulatory factor (Ser/Thr protein kinase)